MAGLLDQARVADARAADQMRVVAAAVVDEQQGRQGFIRNVNVVAGVVNSWGASAGGLMTQLATAPGGATFLPAGRPRGGGPTSGGPPVGPATWSAPVLNAATQFVDDQSNPHYSVGERIGRAAGRGVTVGGSAIAAGLIGAYLGSAVPVVGTVAGFAGGVLAGYAVAKVADESNDDDVDAWGEAGDDVEDGLEDLSPW